MWNSLTLKRSLLQISNAKSKAGLCRSMSHAATHWEGSAESNIANSQNGDDSNNNKHHAAPSSNPASFRGYGTSNNHESSQGFFSNQPIHLFDQNPFFDRSSAAEQVAKQMEDSYYFASFKAKGM